MAEKCSAHAGPKAENTLLQNKAVSNYGLTKDNRLHLKRDFEDIFKNGKKVSHGGLVLWYRPSSAGGHAPPRMGIAVSRKLGIAPKRNRVKRLLREVFRLNRHKLSSGVAFVISPRESGNLKDLTSVQNAVFELWKKAGILNCEDN
ncbi:ribonuclease P protein component [Elusimicrobium simillimum]|uniref:ribonuclease P protein component n=1 Tax=Elusimicrobium simillimum TaxID=3143438 RepID=UPI003C700341